MDPSGGGIMNSYAENPAELEACHHYIQDRVFPLIYMVSSDCAFVRGTGFMIKYKNVNYLITARHVLEEEDGIEYKNIAFPIFGQNKVTWSLPSAPYFSAAESGADFAVVPLVYKEEILKDMFWKPFEMDAFYSESSLYTNQAIFVNGFPREMQKEIYGNTNINIGSLGFLTKLYSGDYNDVNDYNEKVDIVFDYKEEMMINGDSKKIPALQGISGSPMFCIDHSIEGIWAPSSSLKIIGMEKSVKYGKYIRATKASCIYKSLISLLNNIRFEST